MKILVSWLRDYVDVPVGVRELAWALHLLGFEVASVEPAPGHADVDEDGVIDFEITANRPDCLSVIGLAREVATRYEQSLRLPAAGGVLREGTLPLSVTIEAPDLCPRYAAAVIDVTVGSSPAWMQARLAAAGVRAINNVVDVTNYVLLETGHPLHAFDYEKLVGARLRIRRARPSEALTTLDGVTRTMADDMLVIADRDRAAAIAGVMGGGESEVSQGTTVVALESAYFLPSSIRRTSKRLQLSTEASYRFERGADPDAPVYAMGRACQLLEQIGAGRVRPGWIDEYPGRRPARTVGLAAARVTRVIGKALEPARIERILTGLGFGCQPARAGGGDAAWDVTVPTWRGDVARDMDFIEEIARHDGYENLPTTFPALTQPTARPDARLQRDGVARRLALGLGFSECVTFAFVERAAAAPFAVEADLVAIANPLSEKFAVLRPVVLTGVLDSLAHNRRRERRDVQLFETGSRFTKSGGEFRGLALGWTGAGAPEHWSGSGRPVDFFDMKGAVEALLDGLGLRATFAAAAVPWLVPGRAAEIAVASAGTTRRIGACGQLLPAIAAARGVPAQDEVYVAELDLDAVAGLVTFGEITRVVPLPRYPSIVRDVSLVVTERLSAADLRASIRATAPPTLVDVQEFARYQGKGVPEGAVSLSFRLTFRAAERTLTDAEVQGAVDAMVAALAAQHDARLR